jgi:hypothetical protein
MKGSKLTDAEFIERIEKIHGTNYRYDKLRYIN